MDWRWSGCIDGLCNNYLSGLSAGTVWKEHVISQRPYHRHCNCALHPRTSPTEVTACSRERVGCLYGRSWRQINLCLSVNPTTAFASHSYLPPLPSDYSSLSYIYRSHDQFSAGKTAGDGCGICGPAVVHMGEEIE
eukprot:Gb_13255 [translate_table: standard]